MKTPVDIEKWIKAGQITSELDHERAMVADRKLRLLAKENAHFKELRSKLRNLIETYEKKYWNDAEAITRDRIKESEQAEKLAEKERLFIERRKLLIRQELKKLSLTQENLAQLLAHKSKTHMSELINGIKPFTFKDMNIIRILLNININELAPPFLSWEEKLTILSAIKKINKPELRKKFAQAAFW